jgi:hypothetical protein
MSLKTLAAIAALAVSAPLAAQTPIRPGQTVAGRLQEGDSRMEGAFYDAYVIRGTPGEQVVVRMTTDDFGLWLYGGHERDGEWVDDEHAEDSDGTGARLVVRLDESGAYGLRAAGFDEGDQGRYRLRVSSTRPPNAVAVRVGQTLQGVLTSDDYESEAGFQDHYSIRGTPGGLATVIAESRDFDAYLEFGQLQDGEMDVLDTDDDSGLGTTPLLLLRFDDNAEYRLAVSSFDAKGGRYALRVLEGHVGGCDGETPFQEKDDTVAVPVEGSSCPGSPPLPVPPADIVRRGEGAAGIAMMPRLVATLARDRGFALTQAADWRGTRIPLPDELAGRYRNALPGEELRPGKHGLDPREVFAGLPIVLLERMD